MNNEIRKLDESIFGTGLFLGDIITATTANGEGKYMVSGTSRDPKGDGKTIGFSILGQKVQDGTTHVVKTGTKSEKILSYNGDDLSNLRLPIIHTT